MINVFPFEAGGRWETVQEYCHLATEDTIYTLVHANGTSLEVAVHKPQYYLYFLNDPKNHRQTR